MGHQKVLCNKRNTKLSIIYSEKVGEDYLND